MENRDEYQVEAEKYLYDNKVYEIFDEMLRGLMTDLPSDPVEYLLNTVANPSAKK